MREIFWTLETYAAHAGDFAIYPNVGSKDGLAIAYCALGLAGEAGEVANDIKKAIAREKLGQDDRRLTVERRARVIEELGDCLWYVAQAAKELGSSLDEVARENIAKLDRRFSELAATGDREAMSVTQTRRERSSGRRMRLR